MSIVRYVDDIIIIPRWFCPGCVEHIATQIYSKTVNFDPANDGLAEIGDFRIIKFLDLWCYMSWQKTFFALVNKNDLFSFSGLVSLKGKNRFPIPTGSMSSLARRLTCDLQGRLAKFTQMNYHRMKSIFTPSSISQSSTGWVFLFT